jgi:hypothetical protein
LSISEIYGGLDLRAFDWDTNQLVIVAEKVASGRRSERIC